MKSKSDTIFALSKRQSLPEELAGIIIRQIESGQFTKDSILPSEQILAETFNVSRTVVREALARLKYEGLIKSKRGSGPVVCSTTPYKNFSIDVESLSKSELYKVLEFRMIMDGESAALAAIRHTPAQLEQLEKYLEQIELAIKNNISGTEPDYQFHYLVADCGKNEYLGAFSKYLSAKIWMGVYRARWISNKVQEQAQAVYEEHSNILNAIREKNPYKARAKAQQHLLNSAKRQGITLDTNYLCRDME